MTAFNLPERAAVVSIMIDAESAASLVGTHTGFQLVIQDYDTAANTVVIFKDDNSSNNTISFTRDGDDYTMTIPKVRVYGGKFTTSNAYVEPEITPGTEVYYNVAFGYKGPLKQIPAEYMEWMLGDNY